MDNVIFYFQTSRHIAEAFVMSPKHLGLYLSYSLLSDTNLDKTLNFVNGALVLRRVMGVVPRNLYSYDIRLINRLHFCIVSIIHAVLTRFLCVRLSTL